MSNKEKDIENAMKFFHWSREQAEYELMSDDEKFQYKLNELHDLFRSGKLEDAAKYIRESGNGNHMSQNLLLETYDWFYGNDQLLYDLIINVYTKDGYNFPLEIIEAMEEILPSVKRKMDDLPDQKEYIVYRATSHNANEGFSWTVNKDIALWFANRFNDADESTKYILENHMGFKCDETLDVYQGVIKREDILAYIEDRGEYEILQHGHVFDIHKIDVSAKEIEEMFKRRNSDFE